MWLIIGLGNPGKEYLNTRHNAGYLVLDKLNEELNDSQWLASKKFNAQVSKIGSGQNQILLVKPQTFMNESGKTARALMDFYQLNPKKLIVVHDDKDIKLGELKIQINRGAAGHNGVLSIIEYLSTKNFIRVRVGTSNTDGKKIKDVSKFVLSRFGLLEKTKIKQVTKQAVKEILLLIPSTRDKSRATRD